jgi:tetratricopeptide (TPR) repeat protein
VVALQGQAPTARTLVNPREQVQWGLYYPPVLSAEGSDQLQRAAELLALGRLDQAVLLIDEVIDSSSESHLGLALRAVISIALNDLDSAQDYADRAAAINPINPAVAIASSYVKQARLELEQALAVIEAALQEESGNALLWARAGELHLMSGQNSKALAAAKRASELDPASSQASLVYGFAALSTFDPAQASASFKAAIELNSADPMGYLGLGLSKISEGDLEAGRHDLEVAVSLDSNNSILRSYLGKAYFEEKRSPLDAQQYSIAKELDPLDPTPYLYDGILKQTENDPVGALRDVEKSIELNGNRAVYRSRLLLDSDEATRNLSLARIHDDLGFQQLALVEGYESVNTDPTNSSAHRYLADSYSVLPRHEIARVSELLQSQLLNPLNLEPIQPRAAESNLRLISAGGPATASYNEFNSLFKRNQVNATVSGMVGEQQTGSGEAVVGGIYNNWSFSLGASRFETDGFRDNNDQDDNIGNAFIQTALSPDTSLQFEYRQRDTESGDLNLKMDESFSTALRSDTKSATYRGGLRHAFSPNSTMLVSVISKDEESSKFDEPAAGFSVTETRPDDKATGTELQYLYRSANYNITAGAGVFDLDQSLTRATTFPFPPFASTTTTDVSAKHTNAYVYSNTSVSPDVVVTLGASWDSFDTQDTTSESREQVNPKLGVTWQIQPDTTLRAAHFRALKRSLITDQTIEPTQVAGFNQFYDDVASTDAWRSGLALDQKFSQRLYGGVELSRRDLKVPLTFIDISGGGPPPFPTSIVRSDWQEDSGRVYLFATPSDHVSLSIEYQYQLLDQSFSPATNATSFNKIEVHKVPLGIRYFADSGWTFAFKGTYVDETFLSGALPAPGSTEQSSDFWVADATASYRFPKRRGFLDFGATNLFDEQFAYQQVDTANTEFQPARVIFGRLTLYFP